MNPAETRASKTEKRLSGSSSHRVNSTPKVTGTVLWKTIAPVMLPRARVSLLSLTQMTELTFSGSSVARGARPAGSPADVESVCDDQQERQGHLQGVEQLDDPGHGGHG